MTSECRHKGACLKGCLIAAAVGVVLVAIVLGILFMKWKDIAGFAANRAAVSVIRASNLSQQEKTEAERVVDALVEKVKKGEIQTEKLASLFELVLEAPILTKIVITLRDTRIQKSDLSEEEKDAAVQAIDLFLIGIKTGQINKEERDDVFSSLPPMTWSTKAEDQIVPGYAIRGVTKKLEDVVKGKEIDPEGEKYTEEDALREVIAILKEELGTER